MNERYLADLKNKIPAVDYLDTKTHITASVTAQGQFAPDCSQDAYTAMKVSQDIVIGNYTVNNK